MAPDIRPDPPRTVRAVVHAVVLLRVLTCAGSALSLSRLARAAGLSKPATYALLGTLIGERMVRRDDDGRYRPDWGLYELGSAVTEAELLRRAAREPLRRLVAAARGAALVSVLDGERVLYIDRDDDMAAPLRMRADVGVRSPLHSTASGKVFLAAMAGTGFAGYLRRPLRPATEVTITDPHALAVEIAKTKDHGYGVCWGEQERPLSSVAVPVRRRDGSVCAALAVAVATEDLMRVAPSRLFGRLAAAATAIGAGMDALHDRSNSSMHNMINQSLTLSS